MKLYAIWLLADSDWFRQEKRNKSSPILSFESLNQAKKFATSQFGFQTYKETEENGWCKIYEFSEP